jgi:murein L,D-transpeptidase YafK
MTISKPRSFLLAVALSFGLVEACMLAAWAWNAPPEATAPDPTPVQRSVAREDARVAQILGAPYGALLQNIRPRRPPVARHMEESASVAVVEPVAPSIPIVPTAPAAVAIMAPLPPARPIELAALGYIEVIAPEPPARPRGFQTTRAVPIVEPSPAAAPAREPEPSVPLISLASLSPTIDAPAPLRREDGNFRLGASAYVRIFKKEGELELWLKRDGRYALYKTYPICKWSGRLGPKLQSGDYQSPEGFYSVSARQLNPNSAYHRAFNIGFPNAFDRQNGRTGGALMVHGACKSVGCFAMTDLVIDEIYGFVEAALRGGQHDVPVHIFPFRMSDAAFANETKGDWTSLWAVPPEHQRWSAFWQNLKEGYDLFERTGEPPTAYACGRRYGFAADGSCTRIAGW